MKKRTERLRCLDCGAFVTPREVRRQCFACPGSNRHYHSVLEYCVEHPTAGTVVWGREGRGLALNYAYIDIEYRRGGDERVAALLDNPDTQRWPGATPGELALSHSYHRKWRRYTVTFPTPKRSLYA